MIMLDKKIIELAQYEANIYFRNKTPSQEEMKKFIIAKYKELGGIFWELKPKEKINS